MSSVTAVQFRVCGMLCIYFLPFPEADISAQPCDVYCHFTLSNVIPAAFSLKPNVLLHAFAGEASSEIQLSKPFLFWQSSFLLGEHIEEYS